MTKIGELLRVQQQLMKSLAMKQRGEDVTELPRDVSNASLEIVNFEDDEVKSLRESLTEANHRAMVYRRKLEKIQMLKKQGRISIKNMGEITANPRKDANEHEDGDKLHQLVSDLRRQIALLKEKNQKLEMTGECKLDSRCEQCAKSTFVEVERADGLIFAEKTPSAQMQSATRLNAIDHTEGDDKSKREFGETENKSNVKLHADEPSQQLNETKDNSDPDIRSEILQWKGIAQKLEIQCNRLRHAILQRNRLIDKYERKTTIMEREFRMIEHRRIQS